MANLFLYSQIVGVGTKDFDLESSENEYTSLIGSDEKSWGYSFRGKLNGCIQFFFFADLMHKTIYLTQI